MDTSRLELLLNRYLDGELSPAERHELQTLLLAEPDARRQFWRHARLHGSLRLLGEQAWGERDALEEAGSRQLSDAQLPVANANKSTSRRSQWFTLAAAATLLMMLGGWWLADRLHERPQQAQREETPHDGPVLASPIDPYLAIVVDQSSDAKWAGDNAPGGLGHALGRGRCLFENGAATLLLDNGVELQLRGPAELELLSVDHAILHRGQISARVPENAIGFRLDAPGVNVVDLGTEFSVAVDETGKPKVHVFGGKVRAALPTLPSSRTELQAGQTARFDAQKGTVTRIDEGLQEFPELESQAGLPHTSGDVRYLRRAPVTLRAGTYEHDSIMIFEERADFTLPQDLTVTRHVSHQQQDAVASVEETMVLSAGTRVRSYLVHFDRVGANADDVKAQGSITFDHPILGLVIRYPSLKRTDPWLCHPDTAYETNANRILEMRFMGTLKGSQKPNTSGLFDEMHLGDDGRTVQMTLMTGWGVDQFRVLVAVDEGAPR